MSIRTTPGSSQPPGFGDLAPDFEARGTEGDEYRLSDITAHSHVLLIFYPKDMTTGWRNQLSAVGATIERFFAAGILPFGVNPDSAESHRQFSEELNLPFDLLVDEGRSISEAYGAIKEDGSGILRTVVVIGRGGRVVFREAGAPLPGNILQAVAAATQGSP